jgi:hypothetical protein
MEPSTRSVTSQVLAELSDRLAETEDAETAIAIYKIANLIAGQLEDIERAALTLAERDMKHREVEALTTAVGSAGWARPEAEQVDEKAWRRALDRNPNLREIQRDFDMAQAVLRQAQEPYLKLPEPGFFIR